MTKAKPSDPGAALDALARKFSLENKAAAFRANFEKIEYAIQSGAPQSEIIKVLKEHGIVLSAGTFKEYLRRERLRRNKDSMNSLSSAGVVSSPPSTVIPSEEPPSPVQSSDPSAIDSIIKSTPNLEALAKFHKSQQKKGSS
ncbi:MAG: hypothetical protein JST38_20745 [Bacteroidetes bacterium]|nr:hypothetical protein [Bacteroidota bacterium]